MAMTVKVRFPAEVGTPDSMPEDNRVSPFGSDPLDTEKAYGEVPPLALIVSV